MAQVSNYKVNSIIMLQNDRIRSVALVQKGYVEMKKIEDDDIERSVDVLSSGDFIQLLEVLNGFPSYYNVYAKTDVTIVEFSLKEFEGLLLKNPNISLKIIKNFSELLRNINSKIKDLISEDDTGAISDNLFNIGEFYYKAGKYKQAYYVYDKYAKYYPYDKSVNDAKARMNYIKENFSDETAAFEGSNSEHEYYQALNEFANENYTKAIDILNALVDEVSETDPLHIKILYDLGRSYNRINEYDNAALFLQQIADADSDFDDIGNAYKELGDALYNAGQKEPARAAYSEALKHDISGKDGIRNRMKELTGGEE